MGDYHAFRVRCGDARGFARFLAGAEYFRGQTFTPLARLWMADEAWSRKEIRGVLFRIGGLGMELRKQYRLFRLVDIIDSNHFFELNIYFIDPKKDHFTLFFG